MLVIKNALIIVKYAVIINPNLWGFRTYEKKLSTFLYQKQSNLGYFALIYIL